MDEHKNYDEMAWQSSAQSHNTDVPPPEQAPKKHRTGLKLAALALCFSLLGGAVGSGAVLMATRPWEQNAAVGASKETQPQQNINSDSTSILEGERGNTVIDINTIDTTKLMTAAEVYAVNVRSTVGITTSITTNYWGHQTTSAASGSGFIISPDGYILTNFHVIEDSDSVSVSDYDGKIYDAKVIGYDESNDIAVLKIDAEGLSPVILGDSDNLNVGDAVVAIGNPLGELTFSLTTGVISAKGRKVTFSDGISMTLLQTDCAINSGNSGGALLNLYGEVIGVTNAKYSSSGSDASIDNIGFAIPMNSIRQIVDSIIEKGYISKPYLGVSVLDVNESYQIYGLPAGASIQSVAQDSPAQKAGLNIGDIITKAGAKEITCSNDLINVVAGSQVGDSIELTVYRKGQTVTVTVVLGEQTQGVDSGNNQQPQRPGGR